MFSAALQILCQYHCCQHEKFAHLDKPSCQVPRQAAEFSNQPEPIIQKSPDCGNAYANAFFPAANTAKDTKDCCQDSNEVFEGGTNYDPSTVRYLDILGKINREIAKMADAAAEITAGCWIWHKQGGKIQ